MAPRRGQSVERNDEYDAFIQKLAEYHEKRGTTLDPQPKVGVRHVDLWKLYNRVVDEGGYDLVSDTKAKPLMWRKIAEEFIGKNQYTAAQAFQMKNVYYKNLVAYEISTHWGKEPPPKEILEDVTAKGANIMTRTLENFAKPPSREEMKLQDGDTGDATDVSPEHKTPKEEKVELEDAGSGTGGRTTRGLRQQPPQRVMFQPDLTASRQARGISRNSPTPGASANGIMNSSFFTNGASSTLASYEPSQSYPLSLKPVITPANNPEHYRNERKRKLEAAAGPLAKKYKNIMLPGTGFVGPNIYVRAQLALQSGMPDEERYALHHLVKISHERGDKYKFDQFPGLADALVNKVLQVSSLFYDVDWNVSYDEDAIVADEETLDGLNGTWDIVKKMRNRIPLVTDDSVQDAQFLSQLNRITEAGLVFRNMCMLDENAAYASRMPLVRDALAILLNVPDHPLVTELRHYALDIAEQVLKYCDLSPQDILYRSLLAQLDSKDRGTIILALRVIARIAMNLAGPKRLDDVPTAVLSKVQAWLLIEDEELREACLDFLQQYTSFAGNVNNLLHSVDAEALARQLSRLLFFDAREKLSQHPPPKQASGGSVSPVPRLARSVVEELLKFDEPERSSEWLRMCFSPDGNSEMTQISLWQAYQGTFAPHHATHPHLIAGEFIKNVSAVFTGATAQVAGSNKYVIRGIRARKMPVETGMLPGSKGGDKGRELHTCRWQMTVSVEGQRDPVTGMSTGPGTKDVECAEWFRSSEAMLKHILGSHLRLPMKKAETATNGEDKMDIDSNPSTPAPNSLTNGSTTHDDAETFDFHTADKATQRCRWANCQRASSDFDVGKGSRTALFARHVQTHLPDTDSARAKHNIKADKTSTPPDGGIPRFTTLTDERGDAAGVPLGAALVLRNIARFLPRESKSADKGEGLPLTNGAKQGAEEEQQSTELLEAVFDGGVKGSLFYALAHNSVLHHHIGAVLRNYARS